MNLRAVGGGDELGNAVVGDEGTRDRQDESPDDGGKGFGFPVAVGVVGVGGFGGILEGPPDEQGAEEIQQGLYAVSDQGIGAADETTGYLPGRKDKIQENARHDDLAPLCGLRLDIAVGHKNKGLGNREWVIGQSSNQQLAISFIPFIPVNPHPLFPG